MLTLMLLIISFIYISFVSIIFFRQKHVETIELRIFSKLLILNVIGLIAEMLAKATTLIISNESIITIAVCHFYLIYLVWFSIFMGEYVYSVSVNKDNGKDDRNKYVLRLGWLLGFVSTLIVIILPVDFASKYSDYCFGPAVNYLYGLSVFILIFSIYQMLKNIKNVMIKKYLPLIVFIIGLGLGSFIQIYYPQITITTVIESFVLFTMYFTIENPDVKMLEQMELAKEQADQANRAKTDFLSSMSHEIRTPLNAIVGFSNEIVDAKDLEEAKSNAKDIVSASDTLLEIVNGILDISKIEAGKFEIVCSPYNAPDTFKELAKLITPRMKDRGLDFTYKIADDLPTTLYGDHANIKKIVTNFLSNAAKYTEKGFVRFEVNCINNGDNCRLIISVEDSGRGIKKEKIDKLFTKFDRLDVDRNTTVEGTGLGLAITKQLVEMMGGKIVVHTVYGEGSKFTAMIDQKIDETPVETIELNDTVDLTKTKILIVDDNKLNLKVESKVLNRFNCTDIDLANDGYECIDKVMNNKYDIILLDDMMPKMSGSETLKKLKEINGFNTPVVALTANAITGMRESYIAQGFDEYLAKPLEREELVKVLNKLLFNTGAPTSSSYETTEDDKKEVTEEFNLKELEEKKLEDTVEIVSNDKTEVLEDEKEPIKIEEPPLIDPVEYLKSNGVDMDKALELLGDMEMYNMTITDFSNELEDKWSRIEEEKLKGDMENYAIDVHSLKSDCKYLGFYDLADVAYEHELKSKENNVEFVNSNFERLEIQYEKVLNIVKNYVDKLNKGN